MAVVYHNATDQSDLTQELPGRTSKDVHQNTGKPGSGMSSKELRHDGQPGRKEDLGSEVRLLFKVVILALGSVQYTFMWHMIRGSMPRRMDVAAADSTVADMVVRLQLGGTTSATGATSDVTTMRSSHVK
ncbi:hypothetical protein DFS33DRAFT_1397572 [Desarmillaria ectypa]|nr:hypothetical protein DFS33DRAFT_1397572 [Desarmillaria ectypa]